MEDGAPAERSGQVWSEVASVKFLNAVECEVSGVRAGWRLLLLAV